jgi:protein tyrosine/serine phosphatase
MVRKLRFFIVVLIALLAVTGSYALYMVEIGNFHEISPGEAYRSAQLDKAQLEHYIKKYGIRSILNLRGENPNLKWYRDEITVSDAYNLAHYDLSLSSDREPGEEDMRKLLDVFRHAPRPILIHCKAGADRSGLVAAMWKVIVDKEPKSEAKKQLSFFYGHIPVSGTYAMDRFFQNWKPLYQ